RLLRSSRVRTIVERITHSSAKQLGRSEPNSAEFLPFEGLAQSIADETVVEALGSVEAEYINVFQARIGFHHRLDLRSSGLVGNLEIGLRQVQPRVVCHGLVTMQHGNRK